MSHKRNRVCEKKESAGTDFINVWLPQQRPCLETGSLPLCKSLPSLSNFLNLTRALFLLVLIREAQHKGDLLKIQYKQHASSTCLFVFYTK